MEVDTARGRGTRSRIYSPVAEQSAAAASRREKGEPAEIRGGTETILVVEDDDQLRRSAKRILEDAGYQVVTAADGQEALDVLRHQGSSTDLVLSDLVMPPPGGRALYDALRREGRTARFLFASGYSDPEGRGRPPPRPGLSLPPQARQ